MIFVNRIRFRSIPVEFKKYPLSYFGNKSHRIYPVAGCVCFNAQYILMEQPGQAKLTEGFHEYALDVMNTSFSLVNHKDTAK